MSLPDDRMLHLTLRVPANHPELLEGLEDWLERGLVSDAQVLDWCCLYLSSTLPVSAPIALPIVQPSIGAERDYGVTPEIGQDDRLEEIKPEPAPARGVSRILQGLVEEISLRWLLFLGVFLVILSSGVLAASQWNQFNNWGQYLVLLAYTTAFFGVAHRCHRRPQLRLTTSTLQGVSLLLVPVNFWAMDGLRLWQSGMGWLIMIGAVALLGRLVWSLTGMLNPLFLQKRSFLGFVLLAMLQWGWGIPQWPLVAVYSGVLITQLPYLWDRFNPSPTVTTSTVTAIVTPHPPAPSPKKGEGESDQSPSPNLGEGFRARANLRPSLVDRLESHPFKDWALWYSLSILLLRAIFVAGVTLPHLGLAFALAGGLLSLQLPSSLDWVSMVLMGGGWLMTAPQLPFPTIVISGIGLAVWGKRLQQHWLRRDWFILVTIAVQLAWPVWALVPRGIQTALVTWGTELTATQTQPEMLLWVALSPYLIGLVLAGQWFQVHRKPSLANFSDGLAAILGTVLLAGSSLTVPLRTLTLLIATIAAVLRLLRPLSPSTQGSIYLTHSLTILTVISLVQWLDPGWSLFHWTMTILVLAVVHWGVNLPMAPPASRQDYWQRSCLLWAIVLSMVSYVLLFGGIYGQAFPAIWGICWGGIPVMLTLLANQHRNRGFMIWSVLSILLLQGLTLFYPETRQPGLILGFAHLSLSNWYLPYPLIAGLSLGFGLLSGNLAVMELGRKLTPLYGLYGLIYWAVMLNLLWSIDRFWKSPPNLLPGEDPPKESANPGALTEGHWPIVRKTYRQACRGWSILLVSLLGILLTSTAILLSGSLHQSTLSFSVPPEWMVLTGLFSLALVQRGYPWRSNLSLYGSAWAIELVMVHGLGYVSRFVPSLLTFPHELLFTHLTLAIGAQVLGDWWRSRSPQNSHATSLQVIPLVWVVLTALGSLDVHRPWRGLITLGLAWVVLQVGRRREAWRGWVYLGLAGFTVAGLQGLADTLDLNSRDLLLGSAGWLGILAVFYALTAQNPTVARYLRIPPSHLRQGGHLHWGFSTGLLALTIASGSDVTHIMPSIRVLVAVVLAGYALLQARHHPSAEGSLLWSYGSMLNLGSLLLYLWTIAPDSWQQWCGAWGLAIGAPLSLVIYLLPWERGGWNPRPWQQLGIGLPLLIAIGSLSTATALSWLITALSYGVLSYRTQQLRLSYLGLVFLDATVWRWCIYNDRTTLLWYSLPLALSLLWITTVDPQLQQNDRREIRHNLRLLGTGLICGIALMPGQAHAGVILSLSLGAIFAGLSLKIRAFLFVGTFTFVSHSFYQFVILVAQESLLKAAIGLAVGILFIWIAATFETRREQIRTVFYSWADALSRWE